MDARIVLILLAEAAFCLLLLYFSGLLRKPAQVVISAALIVAAFGLRYACLSHVTLDYKNFLSVWVQFFRDNGGFRALSRSVGNYNVPYLYFLALFSYSDLNDLYLIKLLSVFFDVLLAWGCMKLCSRFESRPGRLLGCFFGVLLLPTVVLNGAYWGQCDSIYAAFAVLSVYLVLDRKPAAGMICAAVSFGFKLQAVFLLPVFLAFWLTKRVKLWHFLLFPAAYLLLVLPAVLLGRPLWDTVTLYFSQMDSVGSALNYNAPSVFAFFSDPANPTLLSQCGIAAAFMLVVVVCAWVWRQRERCTDLTLLAVALLFCVAIPFLLPHMHDRYFFMADALSLVFALVLPGYFAVPALIQFASLNSYYAYLRGVYLLYMKYGAAAEAFAILILLLFIGAQLQGGGTRRKRA